MHLAWSPGNNAGNGLNGLPAWWCYVSDARKSLEVRGIHSNHFQRCFPGLHARCIVHVGPWVSSESSEALVYNEHSVDVVSSEVRATHSS